MHNFLVVWPRGREGGKEEGGKEGGKRRKLDSAISRLVSSFPSIRALVLQTIYQYLLISTTYHSEQGSMRLIHRLQNHPALDKGLLHRPQDAYTVVDCWKTIVDILTDTT